MTQTNVSAPPLEETDPAYIQTTAQAEARLSQIQQQVDLISSMLDAVNLDAELVAAAALWLFFVDDDAMPTVSKRYTETIDRAHTTLQRIADRNAHKRDLPTVEIPKANTRTPTDFIAEIRDQLISFINNLISRLKQKLLNRQQTTDELKADLAETFEGSKQSAQNMIFDVLLKAAERAEQRQMTISGIPMKKEWITQADSRVRPAHASVHHHSVSIGDHFLVDGFSMDGPHDPLAPLALTAGCRCHLRYLVDDDDVGKVLEQNSMTASASETHTGAMIALIPTEEDASRLFLTDGETEEQLHLTLLYLGDAVDLPDDAMASLVTELKAVVAKSKLTKFTARSFGIALWNPNSDDPAWVINVGDTEGFAGHLAVIHSTALDVTERLNIEYPAQHLPWSPHICLAYDNDDETRATSFSYVMDDLLHAIGPVVFDRIRVAIGNDFTDVPLVE
jgi:2'-5' RNA ligase